MKKTILISVILICISVVVCSLILVKPAILFRNESGIRVKGQVSQVVESDIAKWDARIYTSDSNPTIAFQTIQDAEKLVIDFLEEKGVKKENVATSTSLRQINKRNANGYETNEVVAFQYTLYISYQSKDIALIESLASDAATLVNVGVLIESYGPQFYYSKLDELKLDLIAKAAENARDRAKVLISGSGGNLGKVISGSQGVFQITSPLSTDVSDYGTYDTSSKTKQITCTVTMEFAVE